MSWVVTVVAGTSLASAYVQSQAAKNAAETQANAANKGISAQQQNLAQIRSDLAPWRITGEQGQQDYLKAIGEYSDIVHDPSKYVKDPNYDFDYIQSPAFEWTLQQGENAINRDAAGAGKFDSGGRSKDLMDYNRNASLRDYSGYLGRLTEIMNRHQGVSQMGMNAAAMTGTAGTNTANSISNLYGQQGNAQAAGQINSANSWTNAMQNMANLGVNQYNQNQLMNYLQNQGGGRTSTYGSPAGGVSQTSGYESAGPGWGNWQYPKA